MKIRKLIFKGFSLAVLSTALLVSSCTKDENVEPVDVLTQNNSEEVNEYVPFFELEKGECIEDGICRAKPQVNKEDEQIVLYSTVSTLKSVAEITPIDDLYLSIRSSNNAPDKLKDDKYTKIPVDLNKGAGGKWIYLYYSRGDDGLFEIGTQVTTYKKTNCGGDGFVYVDCGNQLGWPGNLNSGAGGRNIYLKQWMTDSYTNWKKEIVDIQIIASSSNNQTTPNGWVKVSRDLNYDVGGDYIYLYYKLED